jgi:ATP-dependent DNA ligase
MHLSINPGYKPMEAKSISELPSGNHWQYEPKWDGFRCLAFETARKSNCNPKPDAL